MNPVASRISSDLHIYSKLYYQQNVKPLVQDEMKKRTISRKEQIKLINELLAKSYENEGDDVKEAVHTAHKAQKVKLEAEKLTLANIKSGERKERSPEDYAA